MQRADERAHGRRRILHVQRQLDPAELQSAAGESVESGCKTDILLERIEPETPTNENPRLSGGDYTPFFDEVMLDQMINEWFEAQAEAPAA